LWIFFARTLDRLGKGIRTSARDAMLSGEATKETKARVFGFHRAMDTVGATLGPVLALLLLLVWPGNYKLIFYLAFIPGIVSVLLVFLMKEKKQPVSTLKGGNFFSFFKYWNIASAEYRKLVAGLLLFALMNSSDIFLLLKTKEITGSDQTTILAYIFYNLIYASASYPFGAIADRIGIKKVFLAGLCLFCVVYAGFAFASSPLAIFILFFVYGIYAAATEGIIKAWITNMAHSQNTATAVGFYESSQSICTFFASIIAGFIWNFYGSKFTFMLTAAVTVMIILYLAAALKSQKQS